MNANMWDCVFEFVHLCVCVWSCVLTLSWEVLLDLDGLVKLSGLNLHRVDAHRGLLGGTTQEAVRETSDDLRVTSQRLHKIGHVSNSWRSDHDLMRFVRTLN